MKSMSAPAEFRFSDGQGAAIYCIHVQGALSQEWSDRLAGMTIQPIEDGRGKSLTSLVGRIRDQSELSGVLASLASLDLTLLSLVRLSVEP